MLFTSLSDRRHQHSRTSTALNRLFIGRLNALSVQRSSSTLALHKRPSTALLAQLALSYRNTDEDDIDALKDVRGSLHASVCQMCMMLKTKRAWHNVPTRVVRRLWLVRIWTKLLTLSLIQPASTWMPHSDATLICWGLPPPRPRWVPYFVDPFQFVVGRPGPLLKFGTSQYSAWCAIRCGPSL